MVCLVIQYSLKPIGGVCEDSALPTFATHIMPKNVANSQAPRVLSRAGICVGGWRNEVVVMISGISKPLEGVSVRGDLAASIPRPTYTAASVASSLRVIHRRMIEFDKPTLQVKNSSF